MLQADRHFPRRSYGLWYHAVMLPAKYPDALSVEDAARLLRKCRRPVYKDECWLWDGALNSRGRAYITIQGRQYLVYRLLWNWLRGDLPPGANLSRTCHEPRCMSPFHRAPTTGGPWPRAQCAQRAQA
jgi:hypothetical protein